MTCYVIEQMMLCYIPHVMLCYITHDMLCYITHDMYISYNTAYVMLYNR